MIIPSYLSTGAGVLMLFLATVEFGSAIPLVSKAFIALYVGIVLTIISAVPYNLNRSRRESKGRTKTCVTISVVFLTIGIPFIAITLIIPLVFNVASLGNYVNIFLATLIISTACFIIGLVTASAALPFLYKQKKLRRKEEKASIVFIDEGSGL